MNEQWQELKETITEMRDNDGTGTQQEVCKFLVNYMGILEKQMQEPCKNTIDRQAVLDIVDSYSESQSNVEDVTQDIISDIIALPPVNLQEPKTGHWEQYGNSWEDKFKCSECGKEQPKILCGERIIGHWSDYCPNCGAKMVKPQESEG